MAEQAKLSEEANARKAELKILVDRRNGLVKNTDDWRKANDALMEATFSFQGWYFLAQAKIEAKDREIMLDIYRQITDAVARLAVQKKVDIVFTKAFLLPPTIDLEGAQGLEDLTNRILNQRLLFPDPATITDLTDDAVKLLNAEWKLKKPATPPRPLPTPPAPTPAPRPSPVPPSSGPAPSPVPPKSVPPAPAPIPSGL
jgi:hypothetical protein